MADKTIADLVQKTILAAADELAITDSGTNFNKKAIMSAVSDFVLRIYDQSLINVDRTNDRIELGNPSAPNGPNTKVILGNGDLEFENDTGLWINKNSVSTGGVLVVDPGNEGAWYTAVSGILTAFGARPKTASGDKAVVDYDIYSCTGTVQTVALSDAVLTTYVYLDSILSGVVFAGANSSSVGNPIIRGFVPGGTANIGGEVLISPMRIKRLIDSGTDFSL